MRKFLLIAMLSAILFLKGSTQSSTYKQYEPWMDRYLKGEFGLNPYIDEKGNRDFYERMGYTYSTTTSDKTIYTWSIIVLVVVVGGIYYFSTRKSFETIN